MGFLFSPISPIAPQFCHCTFAVSKAMNTDIVQTNSGKRNAPSVGAWGELDIIIIFENG